jgi:flagellar biosynthesis protein FliR
VPVVRAFAGSFAHVAPGAFADGSGWMRYALALPATILRAAFVVAAPAIAVAAALQLSLAAVARVVPRFSSFTLAFPATFAAGLLVTVATLAALTPLGAHPWLVVPWAAP